jgi:hypothetical protein
VFTGHEEYCGWAQSELGDSVCKNVQYHTGNNNKSDLLRPYVEPEECAGRKKWLGSVMRSSKHCNF